MKKFKPDEFGLVIVDEAHHATSVSWRKVIDYYKQNPDLKIVGLSATPDRTDEMALGAIFQSVAFEYPLLNAINDGWLVPIVPQEKHLMNLDYSKIDTTAGDLNGSQLNAVLEEEKIIQPMVDETVRVIGSKKAIAFLPSVVSSEMFCKICNRHREGMAAWICGETPDEERDATLKAFKEGRVQVLANCGICTEGFDAPDVQYVIMCRPTKSRALFTQMIGRGTRPLPGILNHLFEGDQYYERKEAIAASAKPCMYLLEFTGNCGKHKLVSMLDILGGKYPDEVKARAAKKAKQPDNQKNMGELLKESEQDEIRQKMEAQRLLDERRKKHVIVKATYQTKEARLFNKFELTPAHDKKVNHGRQYTENQRKALARNGHDADKVPYWQGCQILNAVFNGPCSLKQAGLLKRCGYTTVEVSAMTVKQASKVIDVIAKNNWKRPGLISKADVPEMAMAGHESNEPF